MCTKLSILILILDISVGVFGQHGGHTDADNKVSVIMPGVGDVHHPVSTSNGEAQKFFIKAWCFCMGLIMRNPCGRLSRRRGSIRN